MRPSYRGGQVRQLVACEAEGQVWERAEGVTFCPECGVLLMGYLIEWGRSGTKHPSRAGNQTEVRYGN